MIVIIASLKEMGINFEIIIWNNLGIIKWKIIKKKEYNCNVITIIIMIMIKGNNIKKNNVIKQTKQIW